MDVPDLLSFTCMDTTIDWSANTTGPLSEDTYPNGTVCGYFINATSEEPILMSGYRINTDEDEPTGNETLLVRTLPLTGFLTKDQLFGAGSINFKHLRNPVLDALIVSAAGGPESVYKHEPPIIHECALSWCVQTIRSHYDSGKYTEEIISVFENTTAGSPPWESFEIPEEEGGGFDVFYMQNATLEPSGSSLNRSDTLVYNSSYGANNITASKVIGIFDDFFPSYFTAANASAVPLLRYKNYPGGASVRGLPFNPWQVPNNVTRHMERLAVAMTNVMRSSASKELARGDAFSRENYVKVRWEWLTLPLGLLFISLIFLGATVAKSAVERDRVGVWKTSAYATLLYGLPDEMQRKITRSSSTGTPRAKAKELKVKLQGNHGWRVSGNLFSPFTPKPKPNLPPPGWI
jgi:hypothetical protein